MAYKFTFFVDVEEDTLVDTNLVFPGPARKYRVNRELPLEIASDQPMIESHSNTSVRHRSRRQALEALTGLASSWAVHERAKGLSPDSDRCEGFTGCSPRSSCLMPFRLVHSHSRWSAAHHSPTTKPKKAPAEEDARSTSEDAWLWIARLDFCLLSLCVAIRRLLACGLELCKDGRLLESRRKLSSLYRVVLARAPGFSVTLQTRPHTQIFFCRKVDHVCYHWWTSDMAIT